MPGFHNPPTEQERQDALARALVVDTGPEGFFEDIVDAVQEATHAPIALVSFVDSQRQWFKARRGVAVTQLPRALSVCTHTVQGLGPHRIDDATQDRRFRDNPLVTGPPFIRAYLGVPVIVEDDIPVGAVCAMDQAPRTWTTAETGAVTRLARLTSRFLAARRAEIEQHRQVFLESSLARAETRYRSVLHAMHEGMVVLGPSGAIIDVNAAACDILGLTEDEMFGRVPRDPRWRSIHPDGSDFPGEDHPSMRTLSTGVPFHDVIMGVETPLGERRWLSINTYPVLDTQTKDVRQVVAVFRTIGRPADA